MSFPKYPAYKNSGVHWLGEVPEHWATCALKRIVNLKSGETITAESIEEAGAYPVYGGNGLRGFTSAHTHDGTHALIGRQGALCGNVNYAVGKFWASEHAVVATPKVDLKTRWLGELLRAMNLNQYSVSAAQPGLSVEIVGNLGIPLPSAPEQQAIATFLDRETAKIDALVAEQEKLVALLNQKRQSVISHAVTKGLDPSVPMKDSGIEWLGEVPAHWHVDRLKYACKVFPSNVDKKSYENETPVRLCNYTDVYYNEAIVSDMDFMAATATSEQIEKFTLRSGDTIITKDSETADDIAIAAYVPEDLPGIICGYHLSMVRPKDGTHGAFVKRLFDSHYARGKFNVLANGLTRVGLGQYALDNVDLAWPPLNEQQAIATFLDRETAKLDALTAEARSAIALLQERRTALISAAVTGQIDVRDWSVEPADFPV